MARTNNSHSCVKKYTTTQLIIFKVVLNGRKKGGRISSGGRFCQFLPTYQPTYLPTYLPMLLFIMHKKVIIPHTPKKKKLSEIN